MSYFWSYSSVLSQLNFAHLFRMNFKLKSTKILNIFTQNLRAETGKFYSVIACVSSPRITSAVCLRFQNAVVVVCKLIKILMNLFAADPLATTQSSRCSVYDSYILKRVPRDKIIIENNTRQFFTRRIISIQFGN